MATIIKNGTIVSEASSYKADILIEDGVIKAIGDFSECEKENKADIIDATGKLVLPGFIDPHTHMELQQSPQFRSVDDFFDGTVAAACGGTTTIIDHIAFGPEGSKLHYSIDNYHKLAEKSVIDYSFHGVFQHVDKDILEELENIVENEGIPSFKAYTTYGFEIKDKGLLEILEVMKKHNGLLTVHCENDALTNTLKERFVKEGKTDAIYHALSRPNYAEAEAVSRLINIARSADDAPLYIVHTSAKESLEAVRSAREQGYENVFVETCTQYLTMTEDRYEVDGNEEGLKYMMAPPLRSDDDLQELWCALQDGTVQVVATDHCPFMLEQKLMGKDDFTKAPGGVAGVEERGIVLYSEGVHEGRISIERFVELVSTNAAKIFGMYPRKGTILPGADADIVILDPNGTTNLGKEYSHSVSDYSIYEGAKAMGKIEKVISNGRVVVKDGEFIGHRGDGRFIERKRNYDGTVL